MGKKRKKTATLELGAISAHRAQRAKRMKAIEDSDMELIKRLVAVLPDNAVNYFLGEMSIFTQLLENGVAYRTYLKDYESIRLLEETLESIRKAWRGFVTVNVKNNILDDNDGDKFIAVTFTVVECVKKRFISVLKPF